MNGKAKQEANNLEGVFRCLCGYPEFLIIEDGGNGDYWICIVQEPRNLWGRIKYAILLLIKGHRYVNDIVLDQEDFKRMVKVLQKIAKKI